MKRLSIGVELLLILAMAILPFNFAAVHSSSKCGWLAPSGNAGNTSSVDSECAPTKHKIKKVWEYILQTPATQILEGNAKVYLSTQNSLTCLTSSNGKTLWSAQLNNPELVGVWSDRVCINVDNDMAGFDSSNGRKRWQRKGFLRAVYDGQIFYSPDKETGIIGSGAISDGSQLWQYKTYRSEFQSKIERVVIEGNKCIILSRDWEDKGVDSKTNDYQLVIHCLDILTGKLNWKKTIGSDNSGYMTIRDGKILIHLKEIGLNAIDTVTGQTLWFSPSALDFDGGAISVDNQRIIVQKNSMLCLNSTNGKKLWSLDIGSQLMTQPVLSGDRIWTNIISSGIINCLGAKDGGELWRWGLAQPQKSMIAIGDGKIFVVWNEGKSLVALANASDKIVFTIGDNDYLLDKKPMVTKAIPLVKEGQAFVSMSLIIGQLGGYFSYDYTSQNLIVQLNKTVMEMKIGKSDIVVNGEPRKIDKNEKIVPFIKNGYVMIPAKLFGEVFKMKSYINLTNKMLAFSTDNM
ncbi:MAG: PQQ-binding-like beta-propeller repeat protein [Caldisericia bacterium]|nr:PQQ-binding-like beta-propeller repeat protein [Caldisericia bacterium]